MTTRIPLAVPAALAILISIALAPPAHAKKKKLPKPAPVETRTVEPESDYGPQWPPPAPVVAAPEVVVEQPRYHFTRGQLIAGAKAGAAFAQPFSNLGASFLVGVEVGWALPRLPGIGSGLAVTIDLAYTQPGASGAGIDSRLAPNAGHYGFSVTQRELSLGFTALYRVPFLLGGRLVPYAGIGPRIFFLESKTSAEAGSGNTLPGFSETSTRVGLGVPLGADFPIGPGRVFLEAMLLYAPFNHNLTGDSNAGMITVQAGYRFLL